MLKCIEGGSVDAIRAFLKEEPKIIINRLSSRPVTSSARTLSQTNFSSWAYYVTNGSSSDFWLVQKRTVSCQQFVG